MAIRLKTLRPRVAPLESTLSRPKTSCARGYGYRWQQARERFLRTHPLCVMCDAIGRVTAASVVDHVTPHRGDKSLFWDETNWQSLCATHHSSTKQREEKSGHVGGCDERGNPTDPNHPWNR
jgi:5-methylcytosine-specific restriction endonuclease McrA